MRATWNRQPESSIPGECDGRIPVQHLDKVTRPIGPDHDRVLANRQRYSRSADGRERRDERPVERQQLVRAVASANREVKQVTGTEPWL